MKMLNYGNSARLEDGQCSSEDPLKVGMDPQQLFGPDRQLHIKLSRQDTLTIIADTVFDHFYHLPLQHFIPTFF